MPANPVVVSMPLAVVTAFRTTASDGVDLRREPRIRSG
jgi:hypothetical protein